MMAKGYRRHVRKGLITILAIFAIFYSSAIAHSAGPCTITGTVVDQKGNSVPNAFVELIMNGSIIRTAGNPQLSSDGRAGAFGSFNFSGLSPGVYVITAEIATPVSGNYNGSSVVNLVSGDVETSVTLAKFTYTYATPTPIPSPTQASTYVNENAVDITPTPVSSDTNASKGPVDIFKNGTALYMAGMFSLIIVGGAGVFTVTSRSAKKSKPEGIQQVNPNKKVSLSGNVVQHHSNVSGYNEEIIEIARLKKEGKIAGNDYYNRLNDVAEKYRVDQSKILYDISKIRISK